MQWTVLRMSRPRACISGDHGRRPKTTDESKEHLLNAGHALILHHHYDHWPLLRNDNADLSVLLIVQLSVAAVGVHELDS